MSVLIRHLICIASSVILFAFAFVFSAWFLHHGHRQSRIHKNHWIIIRNVYKSLGIHRDHYESRGTEIRIRILWHQYEHRVHAHPQTMLVWVVVSGCALSLSLILSLSLSLSLSCSSFLYLSLSISRCLVPSLYLSLSLFFSRCMGGSIHGASMWLSLHCGYLSLALSLFLFFSFSRLLSAALCALSSHGLMLLGSFSLSVSLSLPLSLSLSRSLRLSCSLWLCPPR